VIGRCPLDVMVRSTTDALPPIVAAEPEHPASAAYFALANELIASVARVAMEKETSPMPKISVTDD